MKDTLVINLYTIKSRPDLTGLLPGSVQAAVQPDQQGEDARPGDTGKGPGKNMTTIKLIFYHHGGGMVLLMTREVCRGNCPPRL